MIKHFTQGSIMPSLVETDPVVLKKIGKNVNVIQTVGCMDTLTMTNRWSVKLNSAFSPSEQNCTMHVSKHDQ